MNEKSIFSWKWACVIILSFIVFIAYTATQSYMIAITCMEIMEAYEKPYTEKRLDIREGKEHGHYVHKACINNPWQYLIEIEVDHDPRYDDTSCSVRVLVFGIQLYAGYKSVRDYDTRLLHMPGYPADVKTGKKEK